MASVGSSIVLVYFGLDTGSLLIAAVAVVAGLAFGVAGWRSPISWLGITVGVLIVVAFLVIALALADGGGFE